MRIIVQPALEPISIAEVKSQQGILATDTQSDAIIGRRITEARQFAENYMQRAILTQTQEVRFEGFPHAMGEKIELPYPNLLSVVSVKYLDTDGVLQTLDPSLYVVDSYSRLGSVTALWGTFFPYTRVHENNSVRIQYTCGYGPSAADVPALLREALLITVGHWMNFQPQAESGVSLSRIPYAVRDILDQFSVVTIA